MDTKKSLLQRYGIPINHLDFKYIQESKDEREMEKIVHILRSGEEGYFPDLTKCAEEKLKELKPQSRLFRYEEQIKGREALGSEELKPIYDWNNHIKNQDKLLQNLCKEQPPTDPNCPPIRKSGRITQNSGSNSNSNSTKQIAKPNVERIKSTDYGKWDKYDPDEELLKIELAEERAAEEVERMNRLNVQKCESTPKILEILEVSDKETKKLENLTIIEKEKLSEEFRIRGNEFFKAKEYDNAITEYTRAIQMHPDKALPAYNNRALTYFKQQKFLDAMKDSEEALKLESDNIKARLRLAESNYACGRKRESYQLYVHVLDLDPQNAVALRATTELRKIFEDLPPPQATRIKIQDDSGSKSQQQQQQKDLEEKKETAAATNVALSSKSIKPKETTQTNRIDYNLADLIKPNKIVQNKVIKAAETLGKIHNTTQKPKKNSTNIAMGTEPESVLPELCLTTVNPSKGKILIEEL